VFHDVTWVRNQEKPNEDVENGFVSVHLMDKQIACVRSSIFMSSKIYFLPHSNAEIPAPKIQCAFACQKPGKQRHKPVRKTKSKTKILMASFVEHRKRPPNEVQKKICCSPGKCSEKITNKMKIFATTNGRCSKE